MNNGHSPHHLGDRVAIVTGAGTGIGRAAALAFARAGAKLVLAGRREAELTTVADEATQLGAEAIVVPTDVSVGDDVAAMMEAAVSRFGRLDIAFNNAGTEGAIKPIVEMSEAEYDQVVGVNLKGTWLCLKHEIAAMVAGGRGGAIVNTSSFLARGGFAGYAAYSASKAGLHAMIRTLAIECGPHGIRINNVLPGTVSTPMLDRLFSDDAKTAVAAYTPLGRLGRPDDLANAVLWLCSDEARFVTGESIAIDGGFSIPGMR